MNHFDFNLIYKKEFEIWKKHPNIFSYVKFYLSEMYKAYPCFPKCSDWEICRDKSTKCGEQLIIAWQNSQGLRMTKYFYENYNNQISDFDYESMDKFMKIVSMNQIWDTFYIELTNCKLSFWQKIKRKLFKNL